MGATMQSPRNWSGPKYRSGHNRPDAINIQNRRRCSRRATGGRPGDLSLPRSARSERRRPAIATALRRLLRRPLDSTQYASLAFGNRCREAGVRPSTCSVGDAYDNAMVESFFSTRECELLVRCRFRSKAEARMAIFSYFDRGLLQPAAPSLGAQLSLARRLRTGRWLRTSNRTPSLPSPLTVHKNGAIPVRR